MITESFYHEKGKDSLSNEKHSHENCYEIIQSLSTGGNFVINDKLYPITYGSIYLIDAINIHYSSPKNYDNYIRNKLIINRSVFNEIAKNMKSRGLADYLFGSDSTACINLSAYTAEQVDNLFSEIHTIHEEKNSRKYFEMYSKIFSLLQICLDHSGQNVKKSKSCVTTVLQFINGNISTELSLDEISNKLHMNKHYLCRQFKSQTGLTIMEYIKFQRLSIAKTKLQKTNLSIAEVAESTGFSSSAYFSNIFKETENITPSEFRRIYQK